ncbi:MAG: prenyltransferase [Gammaproteobacteria bacterium]|nr:prenyltransferase [Gammaproteobacteria bacterium]
MQFKVILQSMRPPFLLLTPICVFLGASHVHYQGIAIDYQTLALVLVGATLAHVSVNTLNEYLDFSNGLDLHTSKTPFSGGSGALPLNPSMATSVLYTGITTLAMTACIGLVFIWQQGINIIPIGIAGLLLIISYTRWINRYPVLCLIAPGLGFGVFMVTGTAIVLGNDFIAGLWPLAAVPFFLVNNLLLLNQYPDIEPDRSVGRRHFPIVFGIAASNLVYATFALLTFGSIMLSVGFDLLPMLALIALLPAPLAFYAWQGANQHGAQIGSHSQYLAANVAVSLATPLLLALSLLPG